MSGDDFAIDEAIRSAFAKGRLAGLEEGAKVAESRADHWKLVGEGVCSMSLQEEAEDIAAAIRALKDKER